MSLSMSVEDLYKILEVIAVDSFNSYIINEAAKAKIEAEARGGG